MIQDWWSGDSSKWTSVTWPNYPSKASWCFCPIGPSNTHLLFIAVGLNYTQIVTNNFGPIGVALWSIGQLTMWTFYLPLWIYWMPWRIDKPLHITTTENLLRRLDSGKRIQGEEKRKLMFQPPRVPQISCFWDKVRWGYWRLRQNSFWSYSGELTNQHVQLGGKTHRSGSQWMAQVNEAIKDLEIKRVPIPTFGQIVE